MTDDHTGLGGQSSGGDDLVEIDLNFESMRRFQAEFSPNLSRGGLFIDTAEPLTPGSVVRFRVILPEEFVFLEGTAVVEWVRNAEVVSDGPPGMALRFVTLSPQNQELVEQLVQDHIDAGGDPFDLDVRPVPADYPTDSLEGAPVPSTETLDEGYRLTLRHTGPSLQAEALQALTEVIPDEGEKESEPESAEHGTAAAVEPESIPADETEEATPEDQQAQLPLLEEEPPAEEIHDFEIVSTDAVEVSSEEVPGVEELVAEATREEPAADEQSGTAIVDDPPEFDWSVGEEESSSTEAVAEEEPEVVAEIEHEAAAVEEPEIMAEAEAEPVAEIEPEVGVEAEPEIEVEEFAQEAVTQERDEEPDEVSTSFNLDDDPVENDETVEPEEIASLPEVLPTPPAFDEGPEVIEDVSRDDLGSPAFDVSLPEHDDEPDTTPVLPDEGGGDVTVTTEDEVGEPPRRRPKWLLPLAAVFVLAVAGGLLWPHARDWLSSRETPAAEEAVSIESPQVVEDGAEPIGEVPSTETEEIASSTEEGNLTPAVSDDAEAVSVAAETTETVVEEPEPEPAPVMARLGPADAVETIEIDAGSSGTVIRIQANGSLEDGVFSMETLPSPPRVLIRLRGITSSFRPYTIEADTAEVARVRSGLHEERRPSELWIVVDLAGSDVAAGSVSLERGLAEIVLARP